MASVVINSWHTNILRLTDAAPLPYCRWRRLRVVVDELQVRKWPGFAPYGFGGDPRIVALVERYFVDRGAARRANAKVKLRAGTPSRHNDGGAGVIATSLVIVVMHVGCA